MYNRNPYMMNKANDSDFFMKRKGSADKNNPRNVTGSKFFNGKEGGGSGKVNQNPYPLDISDSIDDFLSPKINSNKKLEQAIDFSTENSMIEGAVRDHHKMTKILMEKKNQLEHALKYWKEGS